MSCLFQDAYDVNTVQSVDYESLESAITTLLKKKKVFDLNSDEIAMNALGFQEKIAKKEYKEKNVPLKLKLEEVKANSEVLVWFENIGQVSIRSGQGSNRIAIIGDVAGYQIILLEHNIKTQKITGKLLNSLLHFSTSNSASFMRDYRTQHFHTILSNVRDFVQINSTHDWTDASISFHGVFPLIIESGNGSCKFDIQEILENSKIVARKSPQSFQKELVNHKEHLAKLKSKMIGTKGILVKQIEAIQIKSVLKQERNIKRNEHELKEKIEQLNMKIKEVEEEESLIGQQQHETQTMIDAEKHIEEERFKEESNLKKIERDLLKIKEELSKMKHQNRNRINEWSDKIEETYEKSKRFDDEHERTNQMVLTNEVPNDGENIDKEITLDKFDARELGKLRVKFCGNEGAKKTNLQFSLEKQLTDLSDFYKKNEKANFWQNSKIEIFNENDYYLVQIGKGKKRILVTSVGGETKIDLV